MKVGPKSSLRPFLHRALQLSFYKNYFFVLKLFSNRILLFNKKKLGHLMHFKVFSILKARPHHVAASETVAHNVACKVSRVDFHSTSAMLPATISSCVHPLKQAL